LVVASWDKSVVVYDVLTGKPTFNALGHDNIIDDAVFTDDGTGLTTICRDLYARHYNLVTGKTTVYKGHRDNLTAVANFGKNAVTASADATLQIWNRETGETVHTLRGHKGSVTCMSLAGTILASGGADYSVRLWNAQNGESIGVFTGHAGKINAVKFSRNGAYLASASADYTAKVWDVRGARLVFTLAGHTGPVNDVAFSPDGARLATASSDGSARVWDPFTGKQLARISPGESGRATRITFVEYSPDGKRLLITSADGKCHLYDAGSFLRLATFSGHPGQWYKARFSPNGDFISLAQAANNSVHLYRTLPAKFELIDYVGKELKTRELSPEERKRYYVDDPGSIEKQ
jgi:WD40 repeat protein